MQTLEAPVLPCRGCGAPLGVDPTAAAATCPACRAVTPVPEPLRQRARAYQQSLGAERRKVEHARSSMSDRFAAVGKYFGPPLFVIIAAHVVAVIVVDPSYQEEETWGFFGALGLLGVAFFAWLGFQIRAEFREAAAPESAAPAAPPVVFQGSVAGTCSTCGGQVSFVVEQPNARCPYCGATVFPTAAVQQGLLAIAAERADLEVGRASRAHVRSLAATFDAGGAFERTMSSVRLFGLLAMPLTLAGLGGALLFRDGLPDPGALDTLDVIGLVLAGAGLFLLAVFVGVLLLVRRLSRPYAIQRTLRAVGATAGAPVATGVRPVLDWLDAHWAAPVPDEVLTTASGDDGKPIRRFSVATTYAGRPALLVVAHASNVRRTDLFFALHGRRRPEQGHTTQAAQEIRAAGWAVLVTTGGAHLAVLDSDPRAVAPQATGWLLERAAQVARA